MIRVLSFLYSHPVTVVGFGFYSLFLVVFLITSPDALRLINLVRSWESTPFHDAPSPSIPLTFSPSLSSPSSSSISSSTTSSPSPFPSSSTPSSSTLSSLLLSLSQQSLTLFFYLSEVMSVLVMICNVFLQYPLFSSSMKGWWWWFVRGAVVLNVLMGLLFVVEGMSSIGVVGVFKKVKGLFCSLSEHEQAALFSGDVESEGFHLLVNICQTTPAYIPSIVCSILFAMLHFILAGDLIYTSVNLSSISEQNNNDNDNNNDNNNNNYNNFTTISGDEEQDNSLIEFDNFTENVEKDKERIED